LFAVALTILLTSLSDLLHITRYPQGMSLFGSAPDSALPFVVHNSVIVYASVVIFAVRQLLVVSALCAIVRFLFLFLAHFLLFVHYPAFVIQLANVDNRLNHHQNRQ